MLEAKGQSESSNFEENQNTYTHKCALAEAKVGLHHLFYKSGTGWRLASSVAQITAITPTGKEVDPRCSTLPDQILCAHHFLANKIREILEPQSRTRCHQNSKTPRQRQESFAWPLTADEVCSGRHPSSFEDHHCAVQRAWPSPNRAEDSERYPSLSENDAKLSVDTSV